MPHPRPRARGVGVGGVLQTVLPQRPEVGAQGRTRHLQKRPQHPPLPRGHPLEVSGAAQELHQHRLRLVVLGVGGDHRVRPHALGGARQEAVAQPPRGVLEVPPPIFCNARHVDTRRVTSHPVLPAERPDESRRLGRVGAQGVVEVSDLEPPPRLGERQQQPQQRHRVATAGDRHEQAPRLRGEAQKGAAQRLGERHPPIIPCGGCVRPAQKSRKFREAPR